MVHLSPLYRREYYGYCALFSPCLPNIVGLIVAHTHVFWWSYVWKLTPSPLPPPPPPPTQTPPRENNPPHFPFLFLLPRVRPPQLSKKRGGEGGAQGAPPGFLPSQ